VALRPTTPVGPAAAPGGGVQGVVVGQGSQPAEGVADGDRGQGVEPQPGGRLAGRAGEFPDVPEDELALAAGVGGADDLVGGPQELLDDGELPGGALLVDEIEPEPVGDEREGGERPPLEGGVVVLRLLEGDEVAEGPRHLVPLAFEVAFAADGGPEEGSEFAGDRRLLGEDDSHGTSARVDDNGGMPVDQFQECGSAPTNEITIAK
jgi:hypothetical protein